MLPEDPALFQDHIFLLDRDGNVIACRHALPSPDVGQGFFSVFRIDARERAELEAHLHSLSRHCIFFRAGGITMLAYNAFYPRFGFYLVAVPDRSIHAYTNAPALATNSLSDAVFTSTVAASLRPPCETEYRLFCDYYYPYYNALFAKLPWSESRAAIIAAILEQQAHRIARIAGCALTADLAEIGIGTLCNVDLEQYTGFLLLFCLFAHNAAADRAISLQIENCGTHTRICSLSLALYAPKAAPLPDFLKYPDIHSAFSVRYSEDDGRFYIRFLLCTPALETQGLKHPEIYPAGDFTHLPHAFSDEDEIS